MSASASRRSRAALAVVATAVLVGIVMPVAVSGDRIGNPDYVGKGRFDRNMKVEFRIYERNGRQLVNFLARNVKFLCDDGSEERRTFEIIRTKLDEDRREFEHVLYDSSAGDGIYWFRGKLRDRGRIARGFVLSFFDPAEPPDGSGRPGCSTVGRRHWIAKRVG